MTRLGDGPLAGEVEISTAEPAELAALADIERRAASIFPPGCLPDGTEGDALPLSVIQAAQQEGRLFVARRVAGGEVVGFVLVGQADGHGFLEEVDVDPDWGRRGIGRELVQRACRWARTQGYSQIFLSTFREIPWNAPFYARLGFTETEPSEWGEAITGRRVHEEKAGFDLSRRCLMRLTLVGD